MDKNSAPAYSISGKLNSTSKTIDREKGKESRLIFGNVGPGDYEQKFPFGFSSHGHKYSE